MEDCYVVRYGDSETVNRTFYDTLPVQKKFFNKLKKDSSVVWAELLKEPLETDDQIMIDQFEKQVLNILGKDAVLNL